MSLSTESRLNALHSIILENKILNKNYSNLYENHIRREKVHVIQPRILLANSIKPAEIDDDISNDNTCSTALKRWSKLSTSVKSKSPPKTAEIQGKIEPEFVCTVSFGDLVSSIQLPQVKTRPSSSTEKTIKKESKKRQSIFKSTPKTKPIELGVPLKSPTSSTRSSQILHSTNNLSHIESALVKKKPHSKREFVDHPEKTRQMMECNEIIKRFQQHGLEMEPITVYRAIVRPEEIVKNVKRVKKRVKTHTVFPIIVSSKINKEPVTKRKRKVGKKQVHIKQDDSGSESSIQEAITRKNEIAQQELEEKRKKEQLEKNQINWFNYSNIVARPVSVGDNNPLEKKRLSKVNSYWDKYEYERVALKMKTQSKQKPKTIKQNSISDSFIYRRIKLDPISKLSSSTPIQQPVSWFPSRSATPGGGNESLFDIPDKNWMSSAPVSRGSSRITSARRQRSRTADVPVLLNQTRDPRVLHVQEVYSKYRPEIL